jgi:hypothetical protein
LQRNITKDAGERAQRLVAGRVAAAVVELLEVVEVEHDQAERQRRGASSLDLAPKCVVEGPPAEQSEPGAFTHLIQPSGTNFAVSRPPPGREMAKFAFGPLSIECR